MISNIVTHTHRVVIEKSENGLFENCYLMGVFIHEIEQLQGTLPTTFAKNLQHGNISVYSMKEPLLFEKADDVSDILYFAFSARGVAHPGHQPVCSFNVAAEEEERKTSQDKCRFREHPRAGKKMGDDSRLKSRVPCLKHPLPTTDSFSRCAPLRTERLEREGRGAAPAPSPRCPALGRPRSKAVTVPAGRAFPPACPEPPGAHVAELLLSIGPVIPVSQQK